MLSFSTCYSHCGVNKTIENVHQGIYQHKHRSHHNEVGNEQGNIRSFHRFQEHIPHALPLKNGFRQDGKGKHDTNLYTKHRDNGEQCIFKGMNQPDPHGTQPLGPGILDVFGFQYLHHFRANESDKQGQHDGCQGDAGQNQVLQAIQSQKTGLPPAIAEQIHGVSPSIGGKPVQVHPEDINEHDGSEKHRHGNPQGTEPHDKTGRRALGF